MRPIVWTSKALAAKVAERLPEPARIVGSAQEFLDAPRDARTPSILDGQTLVELDTLASSLASPDDILARRKLVNSVALGPVIAICADHTGVGLLVDHPWLCHLMSADTLEHPMAAPHLRELLATFTAGSVPRLTDWMQAGRRIRLTHASSRTERLSRMCEFFTSNGVGAPEIARLRDVGDELLTNAFYNAPYVAGAAPKPISRDQDVAVPADLACELVYGSSANLAIVRVRDPFGSLDRPRFVSATAQGDKSGLGRLIANAALIGVSVVNDRHTEMLVGIAKSGRAVPFALHLFFRGGPRRRVWKSLDGDTGMARDTVSVTVTEIAD